MDITEQLGTIAIDMSQDNQQDIYNIEDAMDQLVEVLMHEDLPVFAWEALSTIRESLDNLQFRTTVVSQSIHSIVPNTHQSFTSEDVT